MLHSDVAGLHGSPPEAGPTAASLGQRQFLRVLESGRVAKASRELAVRDPRGIAQIEEARRHPPLRSFLVAVNSDDSLFATARCKTWQKQDDPSAGASPSEFSSRLELVFAPEQLNFNRSQHEGLARRLEELLTRETAPDALRSELRVLSCRYRAPGREGFCLRITLHARGTTPEQAEMRWGLGLARIQQALLFVSRVLRQQIAQVS